jgi:hypothetical protein
VERFYQERAIWRIGEAFEKDHDLKALVVMATGAGKTRTVVALCDSDDALQLGKTRPVSWPTAFRICDFYLYCHQNNCGEDVR